MKDRMHKKSVRNMVNSICTVVRTGRTGKPIEL